MRYIVFLILVSIFTSNLFSQKIDNDTIITYKRSVISPWGMKLDMGGIFHQKLNQDYIDNKIIAAGGASLFYKELFTKIEVYTVEFRPNKYMHFGDKVFNSTAEFISINLNMEFGYCYSFNKNWSTDFRIGANMTDIDLSNSEEINDYYSSDLIFGAILGLGVERYFKLRSNRYIVISTGIDYYTTDYQSLSSDLSRASINYSLMIGYKFWYSKSVK